MLRFLKIPDTHLGTDFYTTLLQIEATKTRLKSEVDALRQAAQAPLKFIEDTRETIGQVVEIPSKAVDAISQVIKDHPWIALGAATASGAVGGYFDNGRVERLLVEVPGYVFGWISSVVGGLASSIAGMLQQLVVQSAAGAVTGAITGAAVAATDEKPPGAETHRAPVDDDTFEEPPPFRTEAPVLSGVA